MDSSDLHLVLPDQLDARLPTISASWKGFGQSDGASTTDSASISDSVSISDSASTAGGSAGKEKEPQPTRSARVPADPKGMFEATLAAIVDAPAKTFFFAHLNLPHVPWKYLPSGREYGPAGLPVIPDGAQSDLWGKDPWRLLQSLQRHLLQVAYADRLVAELKQELQKAELWDDALVFIVADHGVSFSADSPRRDATEANLAEIACVPLLVKFPRQDVSVVSDAPVEINDIVPTIIDLLQIDIQPDGKQWSSDGPSLSQPREKATTRHLYRTHKKEVVDDFFSLKSDYLPDLLRLVEARQEHFGHTLEEVYHLGPRPELLGKRVAELMVSTTPSAASSNASSNAVTRLRAELEQTWQYDDVDLEGLFLPAHITGQVKGTNADTDEILAIAVNGVMRATTHPYRTAAGNLRFAAMVPEDSFVQGANQVEVFHSSTMSGPLVPITQTGMPRYELIQSAEGEYLTAGEERFPIDQPIAGRWRPIRVPMGSRISGWATYPSNAAKPKNKTDPPLPAEPFRLLLFIDGQFVNSVENGDKPDPQTPSHLINWAFNFLLPNDLMSEDKFNNVRVIAWTPVGVGEVRRRRVRS